MRWIGYAKIFEDTSMGDVTKLPVERRKHKRYTVQEKAFVVLRPKFIKIGKVEDISLYGVSMIYLEPEYNNIQTTDEKRSNGEEIDILFTENKMHLAKIRCRLAYDMKGTVFEDMAILNFEYRRCGFEFKHLTTEQTEQLQSIIENLN
jgi:hypothetical protein